MWVGGLRVVYGRVDFLNMEKFVLRGFGDCLYFGIILWGIGVTLGVYM